jgi:hypothetical protein
MSEQHLQISYGRGFEALLGVLAGARRPGSWFARGAVETPMPALEVAGVGLLSFPVPPAQARQLIEQAAERAPYGRGDQTLVDESVRKVWQVAPDRLKLGGKGWMATFQELVRKAGEELGCEDAAVEAQFYKLLIYEKGGFFLAHRDSEKVGGMFGTLVVVLPSAHEGGALSSRRVSSCRVGGSVESEGQFLLSTLAQAQQAGYRFQEPPPSAKGANSGREGTFFA